MNDCQINLNVVWHVVESRSSQLTTVIIVRFLFSDYIETNRERSIDEREGGQKDRTGEQERERGRKIDRSCFYNFSTLVFWVKEEMSNDSILMGHEAQEEIAAMKIK